MLRSLLRSTGRCRSIGNVARGGLEEGKGLAASVSTSLPKQKTNIVNIFIIKSLENNLSLI